MKQNFFQKFLLVFVLPILIIGGSVVAFKALTSNTPEPQKRQAVIPPVIVNPEEIQPSSFERSFSLQGLSYATEEIQLSAQVSGTILYVHPKFAEGETIKKDEILFKIDDTEYKLKVEQAKSALAKAKYDKDLVLAQKNAAEEGLKLLADSNDQFKNQENFSDLAQYKPQLENAEANLVSANAGLQSAQIQLERTIVKAPFTGVLKDTKLTKGQTLNANNIVGKMINMDKMELSISLSLSDIDTILKAHQKSNIKSIPVLIKYAFGNTTHEWKGELDRTSPTIDPETKNMKIFLKLISPLSQLAQPMPIGLSPTVEIKGGTIENVFSIPASALTERNSVFLYQDHKLEEIFVQVFQQNDKKAIIFFEKPLEKIHLIIQNINNHYNGQEVILPHEKPTEKNPTENTSSKSKKSSRGTSSQENTSSSKGE